VLVLQPGGNDARSGFSAENTHANVAAIREKLAAHRIKLVIVSNDMFRGLPLQSDLMHLTPDGYRTLTKEVPGESFAMSFPRTRESRLSRCACRQVWIPAFAGMTSSSGVSVYRQRTLREVVSEASWIASLRSQ
jgi:hypothetical protein